MKIIKKDGRIKVQSDYNREYISRAKLIEGKWESPYWSFPEENEKEVRALLLEIYGEDGEYHETVDILVDITKMPDDGTISLCSRALCSRRQRDCNVELANGVMLVEGGFTESGGSAKNPMVSPRNGTVLKVKRCPVSFYERVKEMPNVTLCESDKSRKKILTEKKEELLRYIAEIDAELATLQ